MHKDIYKYSRGEFSKPSFMGIIPINDSYHISENMIVSCIEEEKEFSLKSIELQSLNDIDTYKVEIKYKKDTYLAEISLGTNFQDELLSYSFAHKFLGNDEENAFNAKVCLNVTLNFVSDAQLSYYFQLKLLSLLVPNAYMVMDMNSEVLLSKDWLKMIISAKVLPPVKYLYSVKVRTAEVAGERVFWLKTFGLLRCGSINLEIVNIRKDPHLFLSLISRVANLFVVGGYKEEEKIKIGSDGLPLYVTWMSWETALQLSPKILRLQNQLGEVFNSPSGILYAVEDGFYTSVEIYYKSLQNNPMFFIPDLESERVRELAQSQLAIFIKAFNQFGKSSEKTWSFFVKLSLSLSESDIFLRENLWFDVLDVDQDFNLTGKLITQPYMKSGIVDGDVKTFQLENLLADWVVYNSGERFTPDMAYLLDSELNKFVDL